MKKLLIVESPNKAKTLSKLLGDKYIVVATKGHFINLPVNEIGVSFKDGKLNIKWKIVNPKAIENIKRNLKYCDEVYIATDDDREGEKIASDVKEYCKINNYNRLRLLEITSSEVYKKIKIKDVINRNTVNSAIARRVIDRYIGYPLSTLIKNAFIKEKRTQLPNGIGRVIAPALKIIVEKEKEIENFNEENFKKIMIEYSKDGITFRAKTKATYSEYEKKELERNLALLQNGTHSVKYYKKKTEDRKPPAPLITSTLQYSSWYLFYIKPKRTMKIAQDLFESGLITYHRTDSLRISDEATDKTISLLNKLIKQEKMPFNNEDILISKRNYANKKTAQNAHEAIRITQFDYKHSPFNTELKEIFEKEYKLSEEHLKVYELIWYRTMALQLKDSIYDVSIAVIETPIGDFKAQANHCLYKGWEKLKGNFLKASLKTKDEFYEEDIKLPVLFIDEVLPPKAIITYDYTPQKPKRYGIGRFITTLFNKGIARPSTLDNIVENLEGKRYIYIKGGILLPTTLGKEVTEWIDENIAWLNDEKFCAEFEKELEDIEEGKINYKDIIKKYFSLVDKAKEELGISTDYIEQYVKCPFCHNRLLEKENGYYCKECRISFNTGYLNAYLKRFRKVFRKETLEDMLNFLVKNKRVYLDDLYFEKKDKTGNAFIVMEKDKKGNLHFTLQFPKGEIYKKYTDYLNYLKKLENKYLMEIEKLKEERRLLKEKAYKDTLTRAYNKTAYMEDKEKYDINNISLAVFDLDDFKKVNDTYGHDKGDEVLKEASNSIFEVIREDERCKLYRYGGEEFILICTDMNKKEFKDYLNKILAVQRNKIFKNENDTFKTTFSIGAIDKDTIKKLNLKNFDEVFKKADIALYYVKKHGKNNIKFFEVKGY